MAENDLTWGMVSMNDNRYNLAGWLSISMAIIFPLAFGIGIIQGVVGAAVFKYTGPNFGPSDLLFILFSCFGVYVLVMFRHFLHERYQFQELDLLITLSIIWIIVYQVLSLALKGLIFVIWPVPETVMAITYIVFVAGAMISVGVIDILFAVKLFKLSDMGNNLINALAYLGMISGILEVTVILSPLALVLIPVTSIIYGLIFFRAKEGVEFV